MGYLLGSEQEFYNFLDSINNKDRVAIITHNDLDGVASAVFLTKILKLKKIKLNLIKFVQYSSTILKEIYNDLKSKKITKLFILDFNADTEENGLEDFELIRSEINTLLIDHHPSSPNLRNKKNIIKTKSTDCTTFTIFNIGKDYLTDEYDRQLVCSAMITDFSFKDINNLNFIKKYYPDFNENDLKSSVGKNADILSKALIYFKNNTIKPYRLILNNKTQELKKYSDIVEKEIKRVISEFPSKNEYYPKKEIYFYYFESKFGISSYISTELSLMEDKTFIIATNREKGLLNLSARNQSGKQDMAALLRKGIQNLDNSTAGGHKQASGGSINKKDLNKFKENLLN